MRIFISSTIWDLEQHRKVAERAILELGYMPEMVDTLDKLTDEEVIDVCTEKVRSCSLFILLIGFRRGSVPHIAIKYDNHDHPETFVDYECQAVSEAKIPIYVYLIGTEEEFKKYIIAQDPHISLGKKALAALPNMEGILRRLRKSPKTRKIPKEDFEELYRQISLDVTSFFSQEKSRMSYKL